MLLCCLALAFPRLLQQDSRLAQQALLETDMSCTLTDMARRLAFTILAFPQIDSCVAA
jgi:hypothetical protein